MPLAKRGPEPVPVPVPVPAADPEPTLAALLGDLYSPDPELRRAAARGLAAFPQAAGNLCGAAAVEARQPVREAIFTALIRIGTPTAAAGLVPLLHSEDTSLRNAAIEALKTMPEAAADCIGDVFSGPADVRLFGVEIIGALANADSPRRLIAVIEEDTELNVCAAAVDALAECGDHSAIPALLRVLDRFPNEPYLEFAVQTALTRIASV